MLLYYVSEIEVTSEDGVSNGYILGIDPNSSESCAWMEGRVSID
jgi:hypothetical protein